MTTDTESLSTPAALSAPRPFFWSVRRELWENRSLYFAPVIVALLTLAGYAISIIHLAARRRALLLLDWTHQRALVEQPYDVVALMIMATAFVVGIFYSLDAIYGERRDRSILFWKSLPVSDLTSVLAKLSIPLLLLPLLTFLIVQITHLVMLLMTSLVLLPSGLGGTTWERLSLFRLSTILLYGMLTNALWQVPFYAWLLLVSSWARRATFLCALLPWVAICILEKIAFNTAYFTRLIVHRILGDYEDAFAVVSYPSHSGVPIVDRLLELDPAKFFSNPALWLGLVVAAAFIAATVQLRRSRGPL